MLQIVKMDLHKIFAESMDAFSIKGKDLAAKVARTPGYVSEVRRGVCGMPLENFGGWLEACEELAPGFKKDFARRISQSGAEPSQLSLADVALAIDSGRLSDEDVANISSQIADIVIAVSKRLNSSVKNKSVSLCGCI